MAGTMYSGSFNCSALRIAFTSASLPSPPTTYPTSPLSPGSSSRTTTTASAISSIPSNAASISPNSIRYPPTFTCSSRRPTNSSLPSASHRFRSPVRYNRPPLFPLNGFGTNFSPVNPGRFKYPRASPAPPMYNSPTTPTATGSILSSNTYTCVFATGTPIGIQSLSSICPRSICSHQVNVVPSVGPYPLMIATCPSRSNPLCTWIRDSASPPINNCLKPTRLSGDSSITALYSDAVSHIVLTPSPTMACFKSSGIRFLCPSTTQRPPLSSAPQISNVEASK